MPHLILTINAGSSSLKFSLFEATDGELTERLQGTIPVTSPDESEFEREASASGHLFAFQQVLAEIDRADIGSIDAIGHRVVHGGGQFRGPVQVDERVLSQLEKFIPFAPLHQPVQLGLIESAIARFPSIPQVACFDTAIHHTLPEVAARLPLPRRFRDAGLRKYGFHGLSYESVLASDAEFRSGRTVIAHLGNGSSITAFKDGVSVDTSMGFTPTGGIMMGTRTGDLDPEVVLHLIRQEGMTVPDLERLFNVESGLKGVSGMTNDVRVLLDQPEDGNARLAIDMFCYQAAKQIGALATVLGGIDRLVFTGGIGEHSAEMRTRICKRLGFLGITLNENLNRSNDLVVSDSQSRCQVDVVPSDEEWVIAQHTSDILKCISTSVAY